MRVAIVGGAGFVGCHIVRELASRGAVAIPISRHSDPVVDIPVAPMIVSGDQLDEALTELCPDVIVHAALMNRETAETFARAQRRRTCRLIVLSSADVYRVRDGLWRRDPGAAPLPVLDESAPLRNERFPYRDDTVEASDWRFSYDKIDVERAVEPLGASILRLAGVYGPGDRAGRVREYLTYYDAGRPFILLDEAAARWRMSRVAVGTVARAVAAAVRDSRFDGRVVNVAERRETDERGWAAAVAEQAGWPGDIVELPRRELPAHLAKVSNQLDFRYDWVVDVAQLRALGFDDEVPRSTAIKEAIAWERSVGLDGPPIDHVTAEDEALRRWCSRTD